jgi:hypothetical protein
MYIPSDPQKRLQGSNTHYTIELLNKQTLKKKKKKNPFLDPEKAFEIITIPEE